MTTKDIQNAVERFLGDSKGSPNALLAEQWAKDYPEVVKDSEVAAQLVYVIAGSKAFMTQLVMGITIGLETAKMVQDEENLDRKVEASLND